MCCNILSIFLQLIYHRKICMYIYLGTFIKFKTTYLQMESFQFYKLCFHLESQFSPRIWTAIDTSSQDSWTKCNNEGFLYIIINVYFPEASHASYE